MEEQFVPSEIIYQMMYGAITRAATIIPRDVKEALIAGLSKEESSMARRQIETTLENLEAAEKTNAFACGDTGFPLFYVRMGDALHIEGGLSTLRRSAEKAVREATHQSKLRSTMVHPLTRKNPGDNVGSNLPAIEIRSAPNLEGLEIIAVPKGGGAEMFGNFYRMMVASDGRTGVVKFVVDSVIEATYGGKACPPNVVGVGIGGTSDICMRLAKEAAVLRPVGVRHREPDIAELEFELLESLNSLGVGPMGTGGKTTALDVHIEYAMTHTGALAVGVNAQCSMARRGVARLYPDGKVEFGDRPSD